MCVCILVIIILLYSCRDLGSNSICYTLYIFMFLPLITLIYSALTYCTGSELRCKALPLARLDFQKVKVNSTQRTMQKLGPGLAKILGQRYLYTLTVTVSQRYRVRPPSPLRYHKNHRLEDFLPILSKYSTHQVVSFSDCTLN